jgi:hypothetical protein
MDNGETMFYEYLGVSCAEDAPASPACIMAGTLKDFRANSKLGYLEITASSARAILPSADCFLPTCLTTLNS